MDEKPSLMESVVSFALDSGINMVLRGLTLVSKFFLIVYLAKVLPPEQVGVYGLFTVTVSYALYLMGLDFYTYAQREMLSLPRTSWFGLIRNQFMFYMAVYLFVLPLLLLVFVADLLPWKMIGWFYVLLIFEHISQELYRLLVAIGKVTVANLTLFFRGGAWIYAVVLLFWSTPELQGLTSIWAGWSVGVSVSIIVAIHSLRRSIKPALENAETDWRWVRRGLMVACYYLLGTLALRGLFTFDRYLLDLYVGKSSVGVYSFYMSIAGAVMAFADAGVISRLYPKIVVSYRAGKYKEYRHHLKNMAVGIILLYITFSISMLFLVNPALHFIGRDVYLEQVSTFWVLLIAMGIFTLGLVPHYSLYARGADRALLVASILSVIVFAVFAVRLTPQGGAMGMALSFLSGVSFLGCLKAAFCMRTQT